MYLKKGTFEQTQQDVNSEKVLLRTEKGKLYQVSHIVAFVWERLDGEKKLSQIEDEIVNIAQLENDEVTAISSKIVQELMDVNLVAEV